MDTLKGQCNGRRHLSFGMISQVAKSKNSIKYINCSVSPQNGATWQHGVCACRLAKAVVDGKAPILGFIVLHKDCYSSKNCNFVNNSAISVLLLLHNRNFAVFITISSLSLVHNEASEKIIPFTICSDYMLCIMSHKNKYHITILP